MTTTTSQLLQPLVARLFFCCLMFVEASPWSCASLSKRRAATLATTTTTATSSGDDILSRRLSCGSTNTNSLLYRRPIFGGGSTTTTTARASSTLPDAATVSPASKNDTAATVGTTSAVTTSEQPVDSVEKSLPEVQVLADNDVFVKPERDSRQYRMIRLKRNNLKVLLVSDQLAPGQVGTEAASVHVQAGHFDDTLPGLAHFHEHMLFLGTKKYPNEDDYENFLSQYGGGSSNAYTDMEDTNYYFSITTENTNPSETSQGLAGALDRLAQFFVAPNFDADAVDREVKAIDSEYRNGITNDAWRNYQALKSFANQSHPFGKFGCGTYDTLTSKGTETLLQELQTFWDTYYQAYNLRLAVVGHASLDALQKTVEETFGQLPYSEGSPRYERYLSVEEIQQREQKGDEVVFSRESAVHGVRAFGPQQVGLVRTILPLLESRSIKVHFSVPPLDDPLLRESKPYRVLSHILGHESPGSLHALLNDEGYLTGLSSGMGIDASDFCLFSITVALTPKGMAEKDKVLDLIFQWISLVRQKQDQLGDYHDELRQISEVNFRFRENGNPTDFCSNAAENLFDVHSEPADFLKGSSVTSDYDPAVSKAFLDRLRPKNALIVITNSDAQLGEGEEWTVEPWYGAKHKNEPMDEKSIQQWEFPTEIDKRLRIPDLNAYIPNDFSLRCDEENLTEECTPESSEVSTPPVPLVDNDQLRLWHKLDRTWKVPKAFIRLSILTPDVYRSPRSMTYNRIFQRILNDDLNSFVYDANLAGCNYRVSCTPTGYRISLTGYSQKISFLLDTLTARMFSLIEDMKAGEPSLRDKFNQARDGLCRETKNYKLDSPYEVGNYNSRLLIEESVWYIDNYISEMEGPAAEKMPLTMEECAEVAHECISRRIKCEALCMGNMAAHEATTVADLISDRFLRPSRMLSDVETPTFRSLKLPTREEARGILGPKAAERSIPLIYSDLAFSPTEENNAVEVILQAGSELEMGYEGLATFDLISHIAYNSAYNFLRTNEQLGYIVSVSARKTAGNNWSMTVIVQGSVASPKVMEERVEAWLSSFREELDAMTPEAIAAEGAAVAAQLLEKETKLGQEVAQFWGDILNTEEMTSDLRTPAFDRLEKLSQELLADDRKSKDGKSTGLTSQMLKERVLTFFDKRFSAKSPQRRAMSARVYSQKLRDEFETHRNEPGVVSSFADIRHLKQFLSSWPTAPYWRVDNSTVTCTSFPEGAPTKK